MIRAEPSIPANKMNMQSHQVGLNWNMKLKDSIPPTIIPMLAIWVLIFHFRLTTVQITMHSRVATIMPLM